MRAVRFHEHGGPEVLRVDDVDRPEPTGEEVLVEVRSAGVNPVDTYFREGDYEPPGLPTTPGVDVAGEVARAGPASPFAPGDRVFATGLGAGGYAEYALVPGDRLVVLPEGVDFEVAGGAGVAGVTAWRALIDHAGLEPAETCLVHGGSGGVGHAAVQVAAAAGAHVLTTAAPEYHDRFEALGADVVLDYGREDLAAAVGEESVGGGVDVVLDHRLHEYLQFDADVAATGARVVGIGEKEPAIGLERSSDARAKDLSLTLMSMFNTPDFREPLGRLAYLMSADEFAVEVARTYPLEEAGDAQRDVLEESFLGKLVLKP